MILKYHELLGAWDIWPAIGCWAVGCCKRGIPAARLRTQWKLLLFSIPTDEDPRWDWNGGPRKDTGVYICGWQWCWELVGLRLRCMAQDVAQGSFGALLNFPWGASRRWRQRQQVEQPRPLAVHLRRWRTWQCSPLCRLSRWVVWQLLDVWHLFLAARMAPCTGAEGGFVVVRKGWALRWMETTWGFSSLPRCPKICLSWSRAYVQWGAVSRCWGRSFGSTRANRCPTTGASLPHLLPSC